MSHVRAVAPDGQAGQGEHAEDEQEDRAGSHGGPQGGDVAHQVLSARTGMTQVRRNSRGSSSRGMTIIGGMTRKKNPSASSTVMPGRRVPPRRAAPYRARHS